MHGGLFSKDGVTLDDIRRIDRNRQPPEEGKLLFLDFLIKLKHSTSGLLDIMSIAVIVCMCMPTRSISLGLCYILTV